MERHGRSKRGKSNVTKLIDEAIEARGKFSEKVRKDTWYLGPSKSFDVTETSYGL
jgi:hypothetical protein